ncbi:MAG: tetratricopeptide repeat protein [Candidatus Omnitrophica bacterium]|nr:tetratricopeptide repeat protein [Candidatus Omnitrophota bacterium]
MKKKTKKIQQTSNIKTAVVPVPAKRPVWQVWLLIIFGILIYSNTFNATFHFDDRIFVVENPNIRDITNIKAMWHSMPQNSRFVATVSFALNFAIGKLNVVGYHVVNIMIHLINGFLVWWLVKLLFNTPGLSKYKLKEFSNEIGWLSAMLFIAHPLQTQAITYITQRYASLATLFYVLTMCWYLKARLNADKKFFILSGVSALLGIFTKEMTMTLPLMLLLTEWLMFEHKQIKFKTVFIYFLILIGFLLIVPALMQFNFFWALFDPKPSSSHKWDMIMLEPYLMTQLKVWVLLLAKFIVPIHQNVDYDFPLSHNFWQIDVWGSAVLLATLLVFAIIYRKKNVLVSYGILWFFVAISIEFVPRIYVIFEHKMYLPIVGLSMAVIGLWREKIQNEKVRMILITSLIVLLGMITFQRNAIWKDDISLWSSVVKESPNKPSPNYNLGCAYQQKGMPDEALYYFNQTYNSYRYHYKNYVNRAMILEDRGDIKGAFEDLNRAIFLRNDLAEAFNNRGGLFGRLEKYDQALADLNRCLMIQPIFPEAYYNRGMVYQKQNRFPEAVADLNMAIKLNPRYTAAYLNRGSAYIMMQKYNEAYQDLTKAIELNPQYAEAYLNRGAALMQLGKPEDALVNFSKAIQYKPDWAMAYYNRCFVYRALNRLDLARKDALYILNFNLELGEKPKAELKKFLGLQAK